jgi:tRNA(adenine34) deaminase
LKPALPETDHEKFMHLAMLQAQRAAARDEVPVGCVIVRNGKVISRGYNLRESSKDPTAHAEMIAIRKAAKKLGAWRLTGCTIYVTLEPCPMCAGAIVNARIPKVVYGCVDPKSGACGTLMNIVSDARLNHRAGVEKDVLGRDSSIMLKIFFKNKRQKASA